MNDPVTDSLKAELERARAERDRLDVVVRYLEERLRSAPPRARRVRRTNGAVTIAMAAEAALAAGPLTTTDLMEAARTAGASIAHPDNLQKTLRRRPDVFVRNPDGTWSLK
jgi:GAF domain-containing protein